MGMVAAGVTGAFAQEPAHHWAIVVHGGAGVIEKSQLGPDGDKAYRAGLDRAIHAGAAVLDKGGSAMDAVEAHRAYVTRWFYDLSPQLHCQLGELFVSDPRFTATYEAIAPGLATWVRAAIEANAERLAS